MFQQFTLFITRVGWPGITFGKTDADVLIYKKQADRKRKIDERIIESVQHTATVSKFVLKQFFKSLSNLINFKFLVPRRPKNHWKSL